MSWEIVSTLFGPEIQNTAPKCCVEGCNNRADNAGNGKYHLRCSSHHKEKYKMNGWQYKQYREEYCENIDGRLGFTCTTTIMAPNWQIEVDHIDGDPTNNDPSNLQSLCNCCHRYKTMINEENLPRHKRKKMVEKEFQLLYGNLTENQL
jgi:hypothetical protein